MPADSTPDSDAPSQRLIAGHRHDIEGLRALAVLAVLLYHAGVPGFDGGYVGVDVFFVVSGYLMTGLLIDERRTAGTIALGAFYARRARRLLPASVLVLVAVTVASAFILNPLAFDRAARDVVGAGLYVANLRFADASTDYLAVGSAESPVLHYWSLGVEEQFYLVWPLLLVVAVRRRVRLAVVTGVLGMLSLVSFVVAVRWTQSVQPWAFFTLPARVWEFGAGGLAVILGRRGSVRARTVGGWVGLLALAVAVNRFDAATAFPGPWAAVPVLATVAVLLAGAAANGPTSLLARRPLQWIGGRSYAMYLWHWPPLVLLPPLLGRSLGVVEQVAVVVAACGVAVIAQRAVEDPLRSSTWLRARARRTAALAAALTVVAVAVPTALRSRVDLVGEARPVIADTGGSGSPVDGSTVVVGNEPSPEPGSITADEGSTDVDAPSLVADDLADSLRTIVDHDGPAPLPSDLRPALIEVSDDRPGVLYDRCHVDQRATEPARPCEFGSPDGTTTVAIFGDSHMAQWFPAFDRVAGASHFRLLAFTKSGCPSAAMTVYNANFNRPYDECDDWRSATIALLVADPPDLVVIANYPRDSNGFPDDDDGDFEATWRAALSATVVELRDAGSDVLLLGPTPVPGGLVPDCVSAHLDDTRPCDLDRSIAVRSDRIDSDQEVASGTGAAFVDVTDWICGLTTCPVVVGDLLVYRDDSHLTSPFAESLAEQIAAAVPLAD